MQNIRVNEKFHLSWQFAGLGTRWKAEGSCQSAKEYLAPDTAIRGLWNADVDSMYDPRHNLSMHNDSSARHSHAY